MIDFENEYSKLTIVDSAGNDWAFSRFCLMQYDEMKKENVSFITMKQLLLSICFPLSSNSLANYVLCNTDLYDISETHRFRL